jgi:thiosulfate dehydrogenase
VLFVPFRGYLGSHPICVHLRFVFLRLSFGGFGTFTTMKGFLFGLVIGIIIVPAAAFLYIWLGYAPVSTKSSPLPFERRLAGIAIEKRIEKGAPKESPVQPTEPNLLAGAKIYIENCAVCHGTLTESESAIAKGMYPEPPPMLHGGGVADDPVGQTYWTVANGIRLTGMPGFSGSLTEEQIWQVSQLLANAEKLPQSVKDLPQMNADLRQ